MTAFQFRPTGLQPYVTYRVDTAAAATSPATLLDAGGVALPSAVLKASPQGDLGRFGAAQRVLYAKPLTSDGAVTTAGSPVTLTAVGGGPDGGTAQGAAAVQLAADPAFTGTYAAIVNEPLVVTAEGAVGDGSTDDTAAITAAITKWKNASTGKPGDLVFTDRRNYRITSGLTFAPSVNAEGGRFVGHGAEITLDGGSGYVLTIDGNANNHFSRRLTIEGLRFTNGGVRIRGNTTPGLVWGWALKDLYVGNFSQHGLWIDGTFEGMISNCHLSTATGNTTYNCIHADNSDVGGVLSSIDIYGGSTRKGQYGLYVNVGDVKIFGGTWLQAQKEGLYIVNVAGSAVFGAHVEECWQSSGTPVVGQAGVTMTGDGCVRSVSAVHNSTGGMGSAVRIYAGSRIAVSDVKGYGLIKDVYVDGSTTSTATLSNIKDYVTGGNYAIPTSGAKLVNTDAPNLAHLVGPDSAVSQVAGSLLKLGEAPYDPRLAVSGVTTASGRLHLTYFTALRTETINNIAMATHSTAAGATPTLCRMGVYSVDSNNDLTLVAACASDTALFAAAGTGYTRALTSAFSKVAGQRYALGAVVVTGAATPTFCGNTALNGSGALIAMGSSAPRRQGQVAGQTDLPETITSATVANTAGGVYFELTQ